jgi:hypothetical protein
MARAVQAAAGLTQPSRGNLSGYKWSVVVVSSRSPHDDVVDAGSARSHPVSQMYLRSQCGLGGAGCRSAQPSCLIRH